MEQEEELRLRLLPAHAAFDWVGDAVVRTWWFEPALATLCFAFFINWHWYHERVLGVSSAATFAQTVYWDASGPLFQSFVAYWAGLYAWTRVVPPAATRIPDGVPTSATEALYLLAEVGTGLVLYDAIFFALHWAMHEIPCLRSWHARHHEHKAERRGAAAPVESRDTLRHSLADGTLQVLANISVQRRLPWGALKTRLARALHNVLVIWMLTESHCAAPTPRVWRRFLVGVRDHHRHHHAVPAASAPDRDHQGGRYQQLFGYLDDLRLYALSAHRSRVKREQRI